jgi:VWFA-related protein
MVSAALAAFVALASASAQEPQQAPVFRSGTDVVRFDLRVVDASGRAITDLRPEEIRIFEGDTERPVLVFQHVDEPAGTYVEAAMRAVSAEVSSNLGTPRGHLYLLVFDQHHITPGNEQRARLAAESFIARHVRASDRIAVFGLPGPGPELGFTADRTRALGELRRVRGSLERNVSTAMGNMSVQEAFEIVQGNDLALVEQVARFGSSPTADVAGAGSRVVSRAGTAASEDGAVLRRLIQENARTVVAQADADARQFLQRLAELLGQYRSIEGRKAVVLFSEGFHSRNVTREIEQVAAAAAQSYCVFYSMDLNQRLGTLLQAAPAPDAGVEINQRTEPLGSLAAETDGVFVSNAIEQLDAALDRLATQSLGYYLVGFEPSAEALAARGSYRRVSVKIARPGARVSARSGYATRPESTPADRRRAIDAALGAPFVHQGLRLEYTTYVMQAADSGRPRVFLSLAAELPVRQRAGEKADMVFVVRDTRDGRVVASGTESIDLPTAPAAGSASGTSRFRVHFDAPPGSYMMRAVVREPGGLTGSADRRFDVPRMGGPAVTASDLILGSTAGALPVRARAYAADGIHGLLETYGRTPDQLTDVSVTIDLVPHGSEAPVATVAAEVEPAQRTAAGLVRRARFELPLERVPAGVYVTRARVRAGGETITETQRQIEVVTGAAAVATAQANAAIEPRDLLEGELVKGYMSVLKRSPQSPASAAALRGLDLFGRGAFADAARALAEAFALDQTSAPAAFVLGWAHEAAGARRDAIGAWRAAAAIDPTLLPAHLALAEAYLRLSEPALAAQALRAGLSALPDSLELRSRLAQIEGRE